MAAYTTKKCPHCGKTYSFMEPKGTGNYGSPLRICASCGKPFVDKDYREIAISGVRKIDTQRFSFAWVTFIIISLFFAGFGLYTGSNSFVIGGLVFSLLSAWCIYSDISKFDERQAGLAKETKESYERLKDEKYRQILRDLGYSIPEEVENEY